MAHSPAGAVLGLGARGGHLVRSLRAAGVAVPLFDLDPTAVDRTVSRGAEPSAAAVAGAGDKDLANRTARPAPASTTADTLAQLTDGRLPSRVWLQEVGVTVG